VFCVILRTQYSGSANINILESLQTCAIIEGRDCEGRRVPVEAHYIRSPFHTQDVCAPITPFYTVHAKWLVPA
jgi:hypothetical protein